MSTYEETKVQRHFLFRQDKWYGHLFDARLERNRIIEFFDRTIHCLVLAQTGRFQAHLCEDRRAGVVALKFAHLPLARDHPQCVANLGA